MKTLGSLCTTLLLVPFLATQAGADIVRLPPSRAATPIEIPGDKPPRAMVPGIGKQSATPIEIPDPPKAQLAPRKTPGAVSTLPVPIPGPGLDRFDPRRNPGRFSVVPVPIPDPVRIGTQGKYSYAVMRDGTVYGDTTFGYTRFQSMEVYRLFLRLHP